MMGEGGNAIGAILARTGRIARLGSCLWLSAVIILAGCDQVDGYLQLKIRGQTYIIPKSHVLNHLSAEETYEGLPFVRLKPPGMNVHIEHDARSYKVSPSGSEIPMIPHISSVKEHKAFIARDDIIKVICKPADLYYSCGFRIDRNNVAWTVLFRRQELLNAHVLKEQSSQWLDNYQETGNLADADRD